MMEGWNQLWYVELRQVSQCNHSTTLIIIIIIIIINLCNKWIPLVQWIYANKNEKIKMHLVLEKRVIPC
jgi:hypothetical protein